LKKKQIYLNPPGPQAIIVNLIGNVFLSETKYFGVIIFYKFVDEMKHAELKTMKSKTF